MFGIPSEPWPQPPCHRVYPSIRRQIRHGTTDPPLGRKKSESPMTAEPGRSVHKSSTDSADTSCESPAEGYLTPN